MKLTCIGAVFVDCMGRPTTPHFDPKGRNIGRADFVHGGVGRNIAEDLQNAGAEVSFLSSVDDGPLGAAVLAHLRQTGMNVTGVAVGPGGMGVWLVVMDAAGDVAASVSQQLDFSLMESILRSRGEALIAESDAVVLETDTTDAIFCESLDMSRVYGKRIYAATSNMEVLLRNRQRLADIHCFVCNEIEAGRLFNDNYSNLTNEELLEAIKPKAYGLGLACLIVTTGSKGAVWLDFAKREFGQRTSFPAEVRDTSGAGDSFFAGVVFARERGYSAAAAVDIGSLFAARTIEHVGPARPDLGKFLLEDAGV